MADIRAFWGKTLKDPLRVEKTPKWLKSKNSLNPYWDGGEAYSKAKTKDPWTVVLIKYEHQNKCRNSREPSKYGRFRIFTTKTSYLKRPLSGWSFRVKDPFCVEQKTPEKLKHKNYPQVYPQSYPQVLHKRKRHKRPLSGWMYILKDPC